MVISLSIKITNVILLLKNCNIAVILFFLQFHFFCFRINLLYLALFLSLYSKLLYYILGLFDLNLQYLFPLFLFGIICSKYIFIKNFFDFLYISCYRKTAIYKPNFWTSEQDKKVLKHDISDSELSAIIHHSVKAIQIRRSRLKKALRNEQ